MGEVGGYISARSVKEKEQEKKQKPGMSTGTSLTPDVQGHKENNISQSTTEFFNSMYYSATNSMYYRAPNIFITRSDFNRTLSPLHCSPFLATISLLLNVRVSAAQPTHKLNYIGINRYD